MRSFRFDILLDPSHDMSQKDCVVHILKLAKSLRCEYVHLAPPCNTYSAARYPKIRTKKHPDGIPGLKKKDRDLIKTSTLISDNVWDMVEKLSVKGTYISVENPLTSLQLGHDVGQIAKMFWHTRRFKRLQKKLGLRQ
ncbi:unnamed protein product, partial [Cladocopium goreaui]